MIGVIVSILYVSAGLKKAKLQENFLKFIVPNGYWYLSRKQRSAGYLERRDQGPDRQEISETYNCQGLALT